MIDFSHKIETSTYYLRIEEGALMVRKDTNETWNTIIETWTGRSMTRICPKDNEIYVIFQRFFSLTSLGIIDPNDRHLYRLEKPISSFHVSSDMENLVIGIISDRKLFVAQNGELKEDK